MGRYAVVSIFLTTLAAVACSGEEGGKTGAVEVSELVDVPVSEEVRIGSVEDPVQGFSRIADLAVAADGSVYVLEAADREIRVYSHDGSPIRRFGQAGSGPGDLDRPERIGIVGDTLWVSDPGNRRIAMFTLHGDLVGMVPQRQVRVPVDDSRMYVAVVPGRFRSDGRFEGEYWVMPSTLDPPEVTDSVRVPSVLFNREGEIVDTVGWHYERLPDEYVIVGNAISIATDPLADIPLRARVEEGQIVVDRSVADQAESGRFSVRRESDRGLTVFEREFTYRPRPVAAGFVDSIVERRMRGVSTSPSASRWDSAYRSAIRAVPYHPPVLDLRVGKDGSVWLRRNRPAEMPSSWIVLLPDGTARGLVHLPEGADVEWADGDEVWTVEKDALDVPWLARYRLGDLEGR